MAKKKVKKIQEDESFEDSLAGLEQVVAELEGGDLGLADSLDRYEEGIGRLKRCHAQLEAAERRIELLSGVDAEGNPVASDFDQSEAEDLEAKQSARGSKRTAPKKKKKSSGVDDATRLF